MLLSQCPLHPRPSTGCGGLCKQRQWAAVVEPGCEYVGACQSLGCTPAEVAARVHAAVGGAVRWWGSEEGTHAPGTWGEYGRTQAHAQAGAVVPGQGVGWACAVRGEVEVRWRHACVHGACVDAYTPPSLHGLLAMGAAAGAAATARSGRAAARMSWSRRASARGQRTVRERDGRMATVVACEACAASVKSGTDGVAAAT